MRLDARGLVFIVFFFFVPAGLWAQLDDLELTITPEVGKYCHVVRFPAWTIQHGKTGQFLFFGAQYSDYEVRMEGVLSTKFLFAGFSDGVDARRYHTNERYEVDLSGPPLRPGGWILPDGMLRQWFRSPKRAYFSQALSIEMKSALFSMDSLSTEPERSGVIHSLMQVVFPRIRRG